MTNLKQLIANFLELSGLYINKWVLKLRIWLVKRNKTSSPAQQKDQPLYLKAGFEEDEDYDFWG